MEVSEIIRRVRLRLDETAENESEVTSTADSGSEITDLGPDDTQLDDLIKELLPDAVEYVYTHASEQYLNPLYKDISDVSYTNYPDDDEGLWKAEVEIDADSFIRFVSAKFASWSQAVNEPIFNTDPEYAIHQDPRVSGCPERPAVAITPRCLSGGTLKVKIELFAPESASDNLELLYIGIPSVSSDGNSIDIGVHLEKPVVYYLTALVMNVLHDPKGDDMAQLAHSYMGLGDVLKGSPE